MANAIMPDEFIEQLAQCEERVAEFYCLCARLLPKDKDFWNVLADQELGHARILRILKEKNVKILTCRAGMKDIELAREYLDKMSKLVNDRGVTFEKVLEIAYSVENKTIEWKAFGLFDESPPGIRKSFDFIHEQERRHLDIIEERLRDRKRGSPMYWVRRLLSIGKYCKPE